MKKYFKSILTSSFIIIATLTIFTLSINNSSLDSLRANATVGEGSRCKCVPSSNSDCRVGNNIMNGYKEECKESW